MSISEILTWVGQGDELPGDFALTKHPDSFQNNERFFEKLIKDTSNWHHCPFCKDFPVISRIKGGDFDASCRHLRPCLLSVTRMSTIVSCWFFHSPLKRISHRSPSLDGSSNGGLIVVFGLLV